MVRSNVSWPAVPLGALNTGEFAQLFLWIAVAGVLALAGYVLVMLVRRWREREDTIASFTLQDLRDLRSRGEISDQEFAAMRAALLGQVRRALTPRPEGEPGGDAPEERDS